MSTERRPALGVITKAPEPDISEAGSGGRANARDANGQLVLLSNEPSGDPPNVSFEREFGKLIVLQDVIARILAQHENRTLRRIVQQLPSAVFLPVK